MDKDLYIKDLLKTKSQLFASLYTYDNHIKEQKIKLYKSAEYVASKYGSDLSSEPAYELAQLGAEAVKLAILIAVKLNIIADIRQVTQEIEGLRNGNN